MSKNKHSPWSYSDFGLRPSFGFRPSAFGFLCLCSLLAAGCKKSSPSDEPRAPQTTASPSTVDPQTSPVARIHWLGKKRIAAETNAAGFMKIWNLPESAKVEAQTLDKLSTAPWRFLKMGAIPSAVTNAQTPIGASPLLRPLLDDLVQEECYIELRQSTNQPSEVVLAIKLDETRARLWETNLATVIESLGGTRPASAASGPGWQMEFTHAGLAAPKSEAGRRITHHIELTRTGGWTFVGLGAPAGPGLPGLRDLLSRIQQDPAFFARSQMNPAWLELDQLDLRSFAAIFGFNWKAPFDWPKLSLKFVGDGRNVQTRGQLNFPNPLNLNLDPWKIPTNLISAPLTSFTAIRGIGPWLASLKWWRDLQVGAPPNQFFIWASQGLMMQTFIAAPQQDASNQVSRLSDLILQKGAPIFATNQIVKFEKARYYNGVEWQGLPYISPFLKTVFTNGGNYLFGGLFLHDTTLPPPPGLLQQVVSTTNLVAYDWEQGSLRSEQWLYMGQFLRFAAFKEQMGPQQASRIWLDSISPMLGNCVMEVTLTAENQLSIIRLSTLGFSAVELHLLADWLESPDFPRGLHSIIPAPPDAVEKNEPPPPPGPPLK